MTWSADDTSVKVALRIRPQSAAEKIEMCRVCTSVTPDHPQVVLGKDKAFTYDYVFDVQTCQPIVYDSTAKELIEGCFEGYNATILAYGQTGAGKTYTMGTGFDSSLDSEDVGIIPRAVDHLFDGIQNRIDNAKNQNLPPPEFKVVVQFMELYNEEIIDLLDIENKGKKNIKIHEDTNGNIYTTGIHCRAVHSGNDCLKVLEEGALSRTTASTNMNATSSRSHAIFTILVKQHRMVKKEPINVDGETEESKITDGSQDEDEFESLSAKFNFVDLAGSERLKRTGATGERAREGISINQGLLSLGNVISALGDNAKRGCHVPYRDSKLTRLLQDSLGGNSRTVMIACVSPSDRDFMETLNTLKYANRARNIKNKVVVNQDKASKQIAALRVELQKLTLELLEYKQGIRVAEGGGEHLTDTFHENIMLRTENENLRLRIKGLQETINIQTQKITDLKSTQAIAQLGGAGESSIEELVQGYVKEIEELNNKLIESQGMSDAAVRRAQNISRTAMSPTSPEDETASLIELAKRDLRKEKKRVRKRTPSSSESQEIKILAERSISESQDKPIKMQDSFDEGETEDLQTKEDKENDFDQEDEFEDDDEAEEGVSSDSEEELENDDHDEDSLREDIVDLSKEITIKQKLIEELEHSQSRLHALKHQYEEKLTLLQHKIKETESERDRVLKNIGTVDAKAEEKAIVIRKQYEKKITNLTKELTKLQAAKREHNRLLKTKEHNEQQLKILRSELNDMKKTKVRLMKQMRDDVTKAKQRENKFNRQLESMIKENRKRDVDIKRLKEEQKQKDLILKRKQEEISTLRKQVKPVSGNLGMKQKQEAEHRNQALTNGPVSDSRGRRSSSQLRKSPQSPAVSRNAKKKWEMLERKMNDLMLRMKTVANMEHDMERWLQDRDRLTKQLEHCKQRRDEAVKAKRDESVIQDFNEQVEGLMAQMDFIQENILESQNTITDMEEVGEIINATEIITKCSLSEARYLLEHCYGKSVELGQEVANLDAAYKEVRVRLEALEQHCDLQQQLLQHVFVEQHEMIVDAGGQETQENEGKNTTEETQEDDFSSTQMIVAQRSKNRKKRRLTGTPEELLRPLQLKKVSLDNLEESPNGETETPDKASGVSESSHNSVPNVSAALLEKLFEIDPSLKKDRGELDLKLMPPPVGPVSRGVASSGTPNVSDSRNRSNSLMGSTQSLNEAGGIGQFQRNTRISKSARSYVSKPAKTSGAGIKSQPSSASSSPQATRKTFDGGNQSRSNSQVDLDGADVFTRLTSSLPQEADPDIGKMLPVKAPTGKPDLLVCTYTATGHNNAVLSMAVTEEMLITGSKDRTAKVWDLSTGEEVMSLSGHKRDVSVVKYSPASRLVFTVYQSTIKLWDIRQHSGTCVKTISGSIFQLGDTSIMDLGLNQQGSVLYSALGNSVKMVDLRTYGTLGKLSGHHGTVTCLLVAQSQQKSDIVVTGSKDHTIKVYEVVDEVTGREMPRHNLEPPHYDGVQSLALRENILFSGSRDNTIKKWDFKHYQLRQHLLSAHRDWVCSLNFLPKFDVLLSGCRSGSLKLWHGDSCSKLGEINAHPRSINAIVTNSSAVFTASSDRLVRLWKPTSTLEEQLKELDV